MSEPTSAEPLTYAKWLECLDMARRDYGRVLHAVVNSRTLATLLNSLEVKYFALEPCIIMGIGVKIDEQLPDHAIKMGNVVYNTAKGQGTRNSL